MDLDSNLLLFSSRMCANVLQPNIYMEQPEGFTQEGEQLVCKLHKSLYGLKQSPRAWNQKLDFFLKTSSLWGVMRTLVCTLHKLEMSKFSLSSMMMISSWCAIISTSFWKWRKNFFESSKWMILGICIFSLARKWKGIVHNVFFTSTKLGISRRFSNALAWRIAKPSQCCLILSQSWKRMWTSLMRWWRFHINK